ncbi:MAG: hypothetical protein ACREV9_02965 [Burkholderiales bacterium]
MIVLSLRAYAKQSPFDVCKRDCRVAATLLAMTRVETKILDLPNDFVIFAFQNAKRSALSSVFLNQLNGD